jgi:hypothetical protein
LEPVSFDPRLRATLERNLGSHRRIEQPLEGRRHAAVAVVVIDSDSELHGDDPLPATKAEISAIPGSADLDLDGSVRGTAGGAAVILTRPCP